MLQYKLLNPSDDVRFEAPSNLVAALAVILVCEFYGAETTDAVGANVPVFGFKPKDFTKDWFSIRGVDIDIPMKQYERNEVATCLESFCYANRQTSVTAIVDYAHAMAVELRKPVPVPGH